MSRNKLTLRDRIEIVYMSETGDDDLSKAMRWASRRYAFPIRSLYRHQYAIDENKPPFTYKYPDGGVSETRVKRGLYLQERLREDEKKIRAAGSYDKMRKRQLRALKRIHERELEEQKRQAQERGIA